MVDQTIASARPELARSGSHAEQLEAPKLKRGRPAKADAASSFKRLSIGLSDRGYQRLEDLKSGTDAVSAADVIRNALRVYELLVKAHNAGRAVVVINGDPPENSTHVQLW